MTDSNADRLLIAQVQEREASDYRFTWSTYAGWCVLTLGFYSYYGLYRLVQRRDEHFKRRLAFSAALYHAIAERVDATSSRDAAQPGLDNLSRVHQTIQEFETANRRNPAVLVGLRLIPSVITGIANAVLNVIVKPGDPVGGGATVLAILVIVGAITSIGIAVFTNHILNADVRFLETWENSLFENAAWTLGQTGASVPPIVRATPTPKRETALYVLFTVITFGIFAIAWRAILMKDGNHHCDSDDRMEDAVLWAMGIRPPASALPSR